MISSQFFKQDGLNKSSLQNFTNEFVRESELFIYQTSSQSESFQIQDRQIVDDFENESSYQGIRKKKIRKNNNQKLMFQRGKKLINELLAKFIEESIYQANKGFILKELQNCQQIKQLIDRLERVLINMKSILLSQLQSQLNI